MVNAIPKAGEGNHTNIQSILMIPEWCSFDSTGSCRSLLGGIAGGLLPMCYPCEEGYHYAKRHAVSMTNQGRKSLRPPNHLLSSKLGPYQDHQILQK